MPWIFSEYSLSFMLMIRSSSDLSGRSEQCHVLGGFVALFPLRGTMDAEGRIRDGLKARLGDFPAALLASVIGAVFNPLDCCFNLVENAFVAFEQTDREFLIGIVPPKLLHVGRYAGSLAVVLQGIIFHLGHVTQKACPQSQEPFPMKRQVSVRHFVVPYV